MKKNSGHHGGNWKVAYADFVTAMMAFFLLMWLLNSTSDNQKKGIASYFNPAGIESSGSGSGNILGGDSIKSPGTLNDVNAPIAISTLYRFPSVKNNENASHTDNDQNSIDIVKSINNAIKDSIALKEFNTDVRITNEGIKIGITDEGKSPMFDLGSAMIKPQFEKALIEISYTLVNDNHNIAIIGHTDAMQFQSKDYDNWHLGSDRAINCRKVLIEHGVHNIQEIISRAETDPIITYNAKAPENRRIEILLKKLDAIPN